MSKATNFTDRILLWSDENKTWEHVYCQVVESGKLSCQPVAKSIKTYKVDLCNVRDGIIYDASILSIKKKPKKLHELLGRCVAIPNVEKKGGEYYFFLFKTNENFQEFVAIILSTIEANINKPASAPSPELARTEPITNKNIYPSLEMNYDPDFNGNSNFGYRPSNCPPMQMPEIPDLPNAPNQGRPQPVGMPLYPGQTPQQGPLMNDPFAQPQYPNQYPSPNPFQNRPPEGYPRQEPIYPGQYPPPQPGYPQQQFPSQYPAQFNYSGPQQFPNQYPQAYPGPQPGLGYPTATPQYFPGQPSPPYPGSGPFQGPTQAPDHKMIQQPNPYPPMQPAGQPYSPYPPQQPMANPGDGKKPSMEENEAPGKYMSPAEMLRLQRNN